MPSGGHNKKPPKPNPKAKPKPGAPKAPSPRPVVSTAPPASVAKEHHPAWASVVGDLQDLGVVTSTDLDRLAQAFACRSNATRIHRKLDKALAEGNATDISKLQSAHASALKTGDSIIGQIERSVRLRPHKEEEDGWAF